MNINDRIGKFLLPNRSWYTRNVNTITKFSVHHDAIPHNNQTADQVMQSIMNTHVNKNGWPGASYHYYIHRDGTIYQMNRHEWVTWIDGHNWDALGIVLNGYFHPDFNNQPTKEQLNSLAWLLNKLSNDTSFPAKQGDTLAHRERSSTACPGNTLYPYVKEFREKNGNVSWGGGGSSNMSDWSNSQCLIINNQAGDKVFKHLVGGATVRKEVAEYLKINDPDNAPTDKFISTIAGIKSEVSACNNSKNEIEKKLVIAQAEITNREEQVARLKQECQDDKKTLLAQIDALNKDIKSIPEITKHYEGLIAVKQGQLDEQGKQIGSLKIKVAELEQVVNSGKNQTLSGLSLYDLIIALIKKFIPFLKSTRL